MLVLFDIDGTLLRTHGVGREAMRLTLLEVFGTESNLAQHQFSGKTDWHTLVELLTPVGIDADMIRSHLPAYETAMAGHMSRLINASNSVALPGGLDAVTALRTRSDVVLGLVTGNFAATAPLKLRAAGYDPAWFPVGAYGSEAIDRDHLPPLALTRACAYSRRDILPDQVFVIGDTVMDIQCGRALGAVVIAVTTGSGTPEELAAARPDYLLDDLTTVLEYLPL
jgi:phosphoglycolate phosphatase